MNWNWPTATAVSRASFGPHQDELLILDDWGPDRINAQQASLTASQRRDLMEIVEDRYGAGSTLITSHLPLSTWHDVIGEPTFADAILDRIVHNAYRLERGQSLRKTMAKTVSRTAKGDIEKLTPQRSAPQVAGYSGLGGRMSSE